MAANSTWEFSEYVTLKFDSTANVKASPQHKAMEKYKKKFFFKSRRRNLVHIFKLFKARSLFYWLQLNHKVLNSLSFACFTVRYDIDECLVCAFLNLFGAARNICDQLATTARISKCDHSPN